MVSTIRHQFSMSSLTCASCADKIVKAIGQIPHLRGDYNLANGKMSLEAPDSFSCQELRKELQDIADRVEPGLEVGSCRHEQEAPKRLHLSGLSCADCAEKLAASIQDLDGVDRASINFMAEKLYVWPDPGHNWPELFKNIKSLTAQKEPDARLSAEKNEPAPEEEHDHARARPWHIALAFLLLILGIFAPMPSPVELTIFILAYALVGWEVLKQAFQSIRHGDIFNEHFLMSIASLGAFFIGQYPEAVAVMLFYNVGEWAQSRAVDSSRQSVAALVDIQPEFAHRVQADGQVLQIHPKEARIGDRLLIKAGERVPLDGRVLEGQGDLDTSAITGESVYREASPGQDILSGSINVNGLLTMEVTKTYADSTVSVIMDLVEDAGANKAPTERFITRFARYYTPVVVFGAIALASLPPLLGFGDVQTWLYRALVFLVASCPCALVLSVPLTFYAGIGTASRKGILIKGGQHLENLAKTRLFAFDKTGTLTQGDFAVTSLSAQGSLSEEEMLSRIAALESASNHPIARAFDSYHDASLQFESVEEVAGHGLIGHLNGQRYALGNHKLMRAEGINLPDLDAPGSIVHLALDKVYQGYALLEDQMKTEAPKALAQLKKQGIQQLVMLTGDLQASGQSLGERLGLDRVYAELLPQDKLDHLLGLEGEYENHVAYVGDGINDAPVLTQADVGIAMGEAGSDAAIEAADIVITTDELDRLPQALAIAKKTMAIAGQNIVFALGIKGLVLLLGALGLATMWMAVFADVGVTLLCVLNAMRLLRF